MTDKKNDAADIAVEKELEGVPEHLKEDGLAEGSASEELAKLAEQLETARQDILYAQAETQNVRRRMEKEAQDAKAYAATGFARDVLSVSDNLTRALEAIPAELREDEKMKALVTGLEATGRELESVFAKERHHPHSRDGHAARPEPASGDGRDTERRCRAGHDHCRNAGGVYDQGPACCGLLWLGLRRRRSRLNAAAPDIGLSFPRKRESMA